MGNAVRIAELSVHFKIADHTAVLRVKRQQLKGKLRIKIIGVAGRYLRSNDPEFFQKRLVFLFHCQAFPPSGRLSSQLCHLFDQLR